LSNLESGLLDDDSSLVSRRFLLRVDQFQEMLLGITLDSMVAFWISLLRA